MGASGGVGIAGRSSSRGRAVSRSSAPWDHRAADGAEQAPLHVPITRHRGYLDELLKLTGGQGVDVILEDAGERESPEGLRALAMRGASRSIGNRGTVEINPRLAMNKNAASSASLPPSTRRRPSSPGSTRPS